MKKLTVTNKVGKYNVQGVKITTSKNGERLVTLIVQGAYFGGLPLALAQSIYKASIDSIDVRKTLNGGNDTFIDGMEVGEVALFESSK